MFFKEFQGTIIFLSPLNAPHPLDIYITVNGLWMSLDLVPAQEPPGFGLAGVSSCFWSRLTAVNRDDFKPTASH